MRLVARETVILAKDYEAMVSWYSGVLGFTVTRKFEGAYHYCTQETESGIRIGIAPAAEMGVTLGDRSSNPVLLQFEVSDVRAFFEPFRGAGGTVLFGPSLDDVDDFWFGGIADLEGNPMWVVDENCP